MFKTVLVHLRGTGADMNVLAAAHAVAKPFSGHLECLYVRPNKAALAAQIALKADDDSQSVIEMLEMLERESALAAQRAADALRAFSEKEQLARAEFPPGSGKMSAAFRETIGNEVDCLIEQSREHDLIVVKGGGEQEGGLPFGELGRLITSIGRPVLLSPKAIQRSIHNVVIAWKDVPEAARAVTAAMPLLARVGKVWALTAEEEASAPASIAIVKHLAWHGIAAEAHIVPPGDRDAAHAILESARAAKADLIVMGAYGHNRLAELVLGGFTQAVIEDSSLPVFMLH